MNDKTHTDVGITYGGYWCKARYAADGVHVVPGDIAPKDASGLLVVPPKPEEWTEHKARALTLGEAIIDHLNALKAKV